MTIGNKNIAIIPARGGSKRIPRKNIKPFLTKPIIAYSIQAAIACGCFERVMVSTDDIEIADISRQFGADVPFLRSQETSSDYATTPDVLLEVLDEYRQQGNVFSYACCIYPCAPFITSARLSEAYEIMTSNDRDSVFPMMRFHYPIQRALKITNGLVEMFHPEHIRTRSQDLEPAYCDAGQFYWFNVNRFIEKKVLWTDNTAGVVISDLEGHDIDNMEDWRIAEIKYRIINNL